MRRGRYTTNDDWSEVDRIGPFLIEGCDVTEVNGQVWRDGGRRVTYVGPASTKPAGFRAKSWIGETAWSDAERYAGDWWMKMRYAS